MENKHNKKEKFIEKCEKKFGVKFDYSKAIYTNSNTDIEIKNNLVNLDIY